MFQTKDVEKIKIHILCSFFKIENLAICDMMWKNMVEPNRPQTKYKTGNAHCMLGN